MFSSLSKFRIKKIHADTLHGGTQYWIFSCINTIRKIIHECFKCWLYQVTAAEQQMGIHPHSRVNISRPLAHTGMLDGRTDLHIFDKGSVTGKRYRYEVLEPTVRLFQGAVGPNFVYG